MNAHELAKIITDEEVANTIATWESEGSSKLNEMKTLIRLGDSKKMAVATMILEKEHDSELYNFAYYS